MSKEKVKSHLEKHERKIKLIIRFSLIGSIFTILIVTNRDLDSIGGIIGLFGTTVAQSITDGCVDTLKGIFS